MENSFVHLLEGEYNGETELQVSLKSCVPFFILNPEAIIKPDYDLDDIVPYYNPEINYNDESVFAVLNYKRMDEKYTTTGELKLEEGKYTNNPGMRDYNDVNHLGRVFTDLLRVVINGALHGESESEPTPLLTVLIDIGTDESKRRIIEVTNKDLGDFNSIKSDWYTIQEYTAARDVEKLNIVQKSNILLVDKLMREFNNDGIIGGK